MTESPKSVIISDVFEAKGFVQRTLGLIPKKVIPRDCAMLFRNCNMIHTFFMQARIDVVMVDGNNTVVCTVEDLAPFRFAACMGAAHTYELASGEIKGKNINKGDTFMII
jgi:uncharacterized membrane protein (UPF0127 family)